MVFRWWADDGPILVLYRSSVLHSSTKKNNNKKKQKKQTHCLSWTLSDKIFLICAWCAFISFLYLNLYVLRDDACISCKPHIYVSLSTSELRMRLAPLVGWFCCFTSQVNSYGHCGTVSSPYHTFSWAGLNKRLTSKDLGQFPTQSAQILTGCG